MSSITIATLCAIITICQIGISSTNQHQHVHQHLDEDIHDKRYDHESFLGEKDARAFDQLSPAESKKRLAGIVDKIDTNDDGFVSHEELKEWIQKQQKGYINDDVERQWKTHNPDNKTELKWQDYKRVTYGFMDDESDGNDLKDEDHQTYKEMLRRDRRRWQAADRDHDTNLNRDEFTDFLHPEETDHMQSVVVEETMEDIDKDKDGRISLDEYINDMYTSDSSEENVPEWVIREREMFKNHRDQNGDGYMDKSEVRDWIAPPDYDHSDAEAKHLIHESDGDKDGKLSRQEILDNYDLFVGSQATDFGEALLDPLHDEL